MTTNGIIRTVENPTQGRILHRLSVVSTIYHQVDGGEAHDVTSRYDLTLDTDEQVYRRTSRLTLAPTVVDLGWLKGQPVCMICVENLDEEAVLVVQFGDGPPAMRVLPKTSVSFMPIDTETIKLSTSIAQSKCALTVIPG